MKLNLNKNKTLVYSRTKIDLKNVNKHHITPSRYLGWLQENDQSISWKNSILMNDF